jgi:DNA polymerase III epsilon subunit-like protein
MSFVFDLETTGFPLTPAYDAYYHWKHTDKYDGSRIIQISYAIMDHRGLAGPIHNYIIRPRDFAIRATHIHGITEARAAAEGKDIRLLYGGIHSALSQCRFIIAHNAKFDVNVLLSEMHRDGQTDVIRQVLEKRIICTMHLTRQLVSARDANGYLKSPKLSELFYTLFRSAMEGAHDAQEDVANLCRIVARLHSMNFLLLPRTRLHRQSRSIGVIQAN